MFASESWHNDFSIKSLGRRLRSVPIFLLLLPYALGILLCDYVDLGDWWLVAMFGLSTLLIAFFGRHRLLSHLGVGVLMLGFGYVVTMLQRPCCDIRDGETIDAVVCVDDIPMQRSGYRLSYGHIEAWRRDSVEHAASYDVVLWIRHDSIREGDRVHVHTKFRSRMSRHDDYNRLLRNRGYVGGISLSDGSVVRLEYDEHSTLQNRAIRKLERYLSDSATHSTVEAMVVGSRRLEPQHLREAYSRTGLSHLMALSGLHLGIVVMVLAVLLMPVLLVYRGNIIHNIVVIGVLWLYVVMSGASASLVRAALMFSILHLAQASSMRYNSLNTLSVALLAMLIYRPYYLYDISFQLSAMAVIGIVVWGVPLVRQLRGMHFVWHSLLATLIIGVVATLWTLPIVSNTFHAIPLIGVVATPVAMLSAYVIVCCGIFVLILPHPLATPFGWLAERAAWLQNSFVEWLSSADWITIDYRLSAGGVVAIYTIFLLITAVVWSKTKKNDNFVIR